MRVIQRRWRHQEKPSVPSWVSWSLLNSSTHLHSLDFSFLNVFTISHILTITWPAYLVFRTAIHVLVQNVSHQSTFACISPTGDKASLTIYKFVKEFNLFSNTLNTINLFQALSGIISRSQF